MYRQFQPAFAMYLILLCLKTNYRNNNLVPYSGQTLKKVYLNRNTKEKYCFKTITIQ